MHSCVVHKQRTLVQAKCGPADCLLLTDYCIFGVNTRADLAALPSIVQ